MSSSRMPALFLGHGSPMNVLEDNVYTRAWRQLGETLPRPKAIVVVSAHWFTRGTGVTAMEAPKTIHDFGGFPQALYDTHYPAPGSPELAQRLVDLLAPVPVALDKEAWGFDHGSWGGVDQNVSGCRYPDGATEYRQHQTCCLAHGDGA